MLSSMSSRIVCIAVFLLALLVRLPGAGSFMTADEEAWMLRSGEYYHKLFQHFDAGGTFLTTHPGATAMWLIGGGIAVQEHRLGVAIDTSNIKYFRRAVVLPIILATSLLVSFIAWQLASLNGWQLSLLGGGLLAVDPYLVGLSQIAHVDALLALFMLVSVLALLLWNTRSKQHWLVLAGTAAGLALDTKALAALWLFMFFGLLLLYRLYARSSSWQQIVRAAFFFTGVAALMCYIVWPALWTKADLSTSFSRDVPSVITDAHVELEQADNPIEPGTFYIRTLLGRTTPLIVVISGIAVIYAGVRAYRVRRLSPELWLIVYAVGFLALITFVAKKGDRYGLPALAVLPIIAGYGLLQLRRWRVAMSGIVFVTAIAITLTWSPYAIAYTNPFFSTVRPLSQQGWGEGLDQAAAWLNQHPFGKNLYVASWYPTVLGTYFQGKTASLSARDDHRVGFVVLYRNMGGRGPDSLGNAVLAEFKDKQPVHTVLIHGVPYVWVYDTIGPYYFNHHVGELVGDRTVGQLVPVSYNNWNRIDIAMATFSSRANTEDVILEIKTGMNSSKPLRTVVINARDIQDQEFQSFQFEPIPNSAGKTFYVFVRSPTSRPGNAVTVRYTTVDALPGQMVLNQVLQPGDVGYRIP